jgi:1,4-dihydroxy-2-naphthoate polyprenyltransferase
VTTLSVPQSSSFQIWVMACRPKTLPIAMSPVLVGTACAYAAGRARWLPALAALAAALLLQVAANLANDVFDHARGADNEERLGPTRVVQAGLLSARRVSFGVIIALGLALLLGFYLAWVGGWPIVVIGLASMLSAVAYTAGPYPLGYHGLGDLFVLVFFGFVAVMGTAFVQAGHVPEVAWWASIPVGTLATAVLVVNNLRDLATDARAGKRTLAVRLGRRGAIAEFFAMLGVAYLVPVLLVAAGRCGPWVALPLLTLPLGLLVGRRVVRGQAEVLNRCLADSARLLFAYAITFSLGIVIGGALE